MLQSVPFRTEPENLKMSDYQTINWSYVAKALDFYKGLGFRYIEAPWIVSQKAVKATLPFNRKGYSTEYGMLVGSAEQSFIELLLQGRDLKGSYVAATPCFRDDPEDILHQRYFFKVELFRGTTTLSEASLDCFTLASMAKDFITTLGEHALITQTDSGYDLELNGVELGSYGPREYKGHFWAYGTGLAEPRFSTVSQGRHLSNE